MTNRTSTGHEASGAEWLDLHFESARPEYEMALDAVGLRPGWSVLDAGSGSGSFLPRIATLVGPTGRVTALDLAPENVARSRQVMAGRGGAEFAAQQGSILDLPFADAGFDCVWSANVVQYLTDDEFRRATDEAARVLKPGGLLAVKDFDSSLLQILPLPAGLLDRFMAQRLRGFRERGVLGTDCGTTLPARLRAAGMEVLWRRGFLVERWGPLPATTRAYLCDLLGYFASVAPGYDLPEADRMAWRDLAADPGRILDQPDVCYREFFVLTVCRRS